MGYLAGGPSQNVARVTVEAAATTSQTIIPVPGGFVPGYCDVFVGGACLSGSKGDYDDSDGASVKLVKPMAVGTQYRVVAYNPLNALTLNPANYVQKAGDTMSGTLNFSQPGARITANFTDVVQGNRGGFKTNVPNSATSVVTVPDGSGNGSNVLICAGPDASNSPFMQLVCNSSGAQIACAATGSGTVPNYSLIVGAAARYTCDSAGNHVFSGASYQMNGTGITINMGTTFANNVSVGAALSVLGGSIELGSITTVQTPFIDFHSTGTNNDYDARIIGASGVPGQIGMGNLQYLGKAGHYFIGNVNVQDAGAHFSYQLKFYAGSYAPCIRGNDSGGIEIVNSANTRVNFQVNDAATTTIGAYGINANKMVVQGFGANLGAGGVFVASTDAAWACAFQNWQGTSVGSIALNGTTTTYTTTSDYRLKENVANLGDGLDRVMLLRPISFTWIRDGKPARGFLAHELQEIEPDAVTGTKDEVAPNIMDPEGPDEPRYQGVDMSFLVPDLVSAVQALKLQLDTALNRIAVLEGEAS